MSIISLAASKCYSSETGCLNVCLGDCLERDRRFCCDGKTVDEIATGANTMFVVIMVCLPLIVIIIGAVIGVCCYLRAKRQRQQAVLATVPGGQQGQVYLQNGQSVVYAQQAPV